GLPVPDSIFTAVPENVEQTLRLLGDDYPMVIKTISGTQGQGVILGESASAAQSIAEAFLRLKEEIMLQRFVEEAKGSDVRIFIVGGEVVASMQRNARGDEFRSNLHRGASSRNIRITRQEADLACRAAQLMGLHVAGVDILRSHTGPVILEVNASPGLEGIEGTTGVDIAGHIISYIESKVPEPAPVEIKA